MAKTVANMLAGLADYFTTSGPATPVGNLKAKIESRFWAQGSPLLIATLESLQAEPQASHGQFIAYREVGTRSGRLVGGKEAKLRITTVEFGCFGKLDAEAKALRDLLYGVIVQGGLDNFVGAWGSSPAVDIRNAHWDYDGENTDFDEIRKLTAAEAQLIVPWINN